MKLPEIYKRAGSDFGDEIVKAAKEFDCVTDVLGRYYNGPDVLTKPMALKEMVIGLVSKIEAERDDAAEMAAGEDW